MNEREAIARLRNGDIGGLEFLVRQYQVRAVRAAYLITHDQSLAQDVVQTAFVKVYERVAQFDPERPFGPWFLQIVLNDAIKAANKQARLVTLDVTDDQSGTIEPTALPHGGPGPEEIWENVETNEEVWAALRQLTPTQRAAVVARYYLGWSEARMAEKFSCSPSAIKWRLYAARERLRLLRRPALPE